MKKYKISVITVLLNAEQEIQQTLESVVGQSYPNKEIIVIDGGSTDRSPEIIEQYRDRIDRFYSGKDKGIYDAMNRGMEMAEGDFIIFMNAGDTFFNELTLEKTVREMDDPDTLYYGQAAFTDAGGNVTRIYGKQVTRYRFAKQNICHQSVFYPHCWYKNRKYDLTYPILADWVYNLTAYKEIPFRFLPFVICNFDTTGISFTSRKDPFYAKQGELVLQNLGKRAYLFFRIRKVLKDSLLDPLKNRSRRKK